MLLKVSVNATGWYTVVTACSQKATIQVTYSAGRVSTGWQEYPSDICITQIGLLLHI